MSVKLKPVSMLRVVEIFDSIDGEGKGSGQLATFIRLAGCNMRCSYCDTDYALDGDAGDLMKVPDIVSKVLAMWNKNVTITGGEPLIHPETKNLVMQLLHMGLNVNIETNGSCDIRDYLMKDVTVTMDYKTPSSGMRERMDMANIPFLRGTDVLKIVCKESDFPDIKQMLDRERPKASIYLSPIWGTIQPSRLVDFAKEIRDDLLLYPIVQVQLHKIIWNPDKRGV